MENCLEQLGKHKVDIPWDDDIDIAMPRSNYETFIKSFNSSEYTVKSHCLDAKYPFPKEV